MVDFDKLKKVRDGDFSSFRRDGQGQFSPVIAEDEQLYEAAVEVAEIIERTGRRTLNFAEFLEEHTQFIPDCARDDVDMYIMEGSESNSDHVGGMKKDELLDVLEAKQHCAVCPIKRECLAVSMTQPQMSANRRTEPRLPKRPDEEGTTINLVMSEYLIFGGYTPQERKRIFTYLRDILLDKDQRTTGQVDTCEDEGFGLDDVIAETGAPDLVGILVSGTLGTGNIR